MAETPAIEIKKINKVFGKIHALTNLFLEVNQGQIYGLLGANGAGKTTLIRLLVGNSKPSSGEMFILGFHPQKQKWAMRQMIGYMPQVPALYDDLSPIENIKFFGRAHQTRNLSRRVDEVIDFIGLSKRARDPIYKFSGGMKQRVSLACALVHQPKVLFLDEPTSGIDPKLREDFWKHFRELSREGVTVIVSTRQMDEALYCDRLAILHEGNLLVDDEPQKIMWENRSRINIWRGENLREEIVTNYPVSLPAVLQADGLDKTVSRIEIHEDSLEAIILRMINKRSSRQHLEIDDDQNN